MLIRKESVEDALRHTCLHWNATVYAWVGELLNGTVLLVSARLYQEHLRAYLVTCGIAWKTYADYQREAQEEAQTAWQLQCHAEDGLRANLAWWEQLALQAYEQDPELHLLSLPSTRYPDTRS